MYKLVTLKYKLGLDFKSTYRLGLRFKYFKLQVHNYVRNHINATTVLR